MRSWPDHGLVVAGQGHGDDAHGYGSGFRCEGGQLVSSVELGDGESG